MKQKIFLLTLALFNAMLLDAQTWQWIPKNNFPAASRYSTAYCEINGKGYMAFGNNGSGMLDLWQYNPATDSWTQKAGFIGTTRWSSPAFSIGTDGYFFGGLTSSGYTSDLYRYDATSDNWWLVSMNCPLPGRQDAFGFEINGKGYITCGFSSIHRDDLWEYNPVGSVWTQKANFMGGARSGITGFVIGTDAFVGLGSDGISHNDFYKYNSLLNSWSPIASFPGTIRHSAAGFAINGKGYTGMGSNDNETVFYTDFYEYDPVSNTWTPSATFFNQGISYPFVFQFSNTAFVGNGWDSTAHYTNKVYQLVVDSSNDLTEIANADLVHIYPNPFFDEIIITLPVSSVAKPDIKIFDLHGKIVAEQIAENSTNKYEYRFNFKNQTLASGIYLLKIDNEDYTYSKKIIKL